VTGDSLNFPADFIGSALIHAAATAIGNSVHLKFKWREAPVLYMAFIGDPGTYKSHTISWAHQPLVKHDELQYAKYQSGEEEVPILKETILNDATIEAVNEALSINRRGICLIADELSGHLSAGGKKSPTLFNTLEQKIGKNKSENC
jgi:hypothetical protein